MPKTNKEQLMKIANNCSAYNFEHNSSLRSEAKIMGETTRSCENCIHYTKNHRCDIDLIDEILSSMAMDLENEY